MSSMSRLVLRCGPAIVCLCLAAVACNDDDPARPAHPPQASFTLSPATGQVGTPFSFDASGCLDAEDAPSALEVRWDWEDDGIWDTPFTAEKTATHQYRVDGPYGVRLEVRDSGGSTGQADRHLHVTRPPYRLFLTGGSLNGQPVSASENAVEMELGQALIGTLRFRAENDNTTGATVPIEYAWSWGDHESGWAQAFENVPHGTQLYTLNINLTGTSTHPRTHVLSFGMRAEQANGWIASMTSSTCGGSPIWDDGNDLADLYPGDMNLTSGYAMVPGWDCAYPCPNGCANLWPMGLTYVKVTVLPTRDP